MTTTTDKRKRPNGEKRQPINRLVAPATLKLLKELSGSLGISEGRVIDRAVQALAVAESFGAQHLNIQPCETNRAEMQRRNEELRSMREAFGGLHSARMATSASRSGGGE